MDGRKFCCRILFYVLGLFVMAFGVTFAANSNLGMSPVNSIPAVLSAITNIEMGTCVILIFSLFIVAQILIKRREFRLIDLTQLIFSTIFGFFLDFTNFLMGGFCLPTVAGRVVMMLISLVLIAIGVSAYVATDLINMPMEGMTLAITQAVKDKTFRQVKVVVDTATVVIALVLSLVIYGYDSAQSGYYRLSHQPGLCGHHCERRGRGDRHGSRSEGGPPSHPPHLLRLLGPGGPIITKMPREA